MTKYIIHTVTRATPNNKNFHGDVVEGYHGKCGVTCGLYHNHGAELITSKPFYARHDAMAHGYSRVSDAKKNYQWKNPQNDEFWVTELVEIIPIEV